MYWTLRSKAPAFVMETGTVIARINIAHFKTVPKVVARGENEEETASSLKF